MKRNAIRNAIESLESRQLMAATFRGSDVRILEDPKGDRSKDNGNDVVLKFNAPIKSADLSKMRMFGYSNNTILGGQNKTTINIKSVKVEGSTVVLRTDVQIRKGSTVTVNAGGITDANNEQVTVSHRTSKGLNRDRFTLALRSFSPSNKSYFSSAVLTGGSAPQTASVTPSASSVGTALSSFLDKKVKEKTITAAQKTATMARYNDAAVVAKVPAANLRAGILSLVGTVGEPAIAFYLDQKNTTGKDFSKIDFDGENFSADAKINETEYTSTGKLRQVWNPQFAGESFVVLSGLLAHEVAHEGRETFPTGVFQVNSQEEEVIANTIENMVYSQQIVTDFEYAKQKTTLTLRANYRTLLLLNSGDRQFPRVGIKDAPLVRTTTANPGFKATDYDQSPSSPSHGSFEDDIREEFIDRNVSAKDATATYPTVRAVLKNITGNNYTSSTTFSKALIDDIDISQDTMGDPFAMRVARVLQVAVKI